MNNNITTSSTKVTIPTLNQTFGEWQKAQVSNKITDKTNGFYMANAVKVTSSGATETLVLIDKDKVTTTESAAQPAATIHVERGVAKVTMTTFSQMNVEGIDGDKVTITAWDLDVTNKNLILYTMSTTLPVLPVIGAKFGVSHVSPAGIQHSTVLTGV